MSPRRINSMINLKKHKNLSRESILIFSLNLDKFTPVY
jgi:hypothetical protein